MERERATPKPRLMTALVTGAQTIKAEVPIARKRVKIPTRSLSFIAAS
jgi:hypothetical protein